MPTNIAEADLTNTHRAITEVKSKKIKMSIRMIYLEGNFSRTKHKSIFSGTGKNSSETPDQII